MSIEQALADVTAALNKNSALMEAIIANAKARAPGAPAATEKAEDKKAEKAEKPAEEKKAETRGRPAGSGKKGPKIADLENAAKNLLSGLKGDEKEDRKAFVEKMLAHFGGERITKIAEEHWAEAIDCMNRKAEGEDVTFGDDAAEENGDDGSSLI